MTRNIEHTDTLLKAGECDLNCAKTFSVFSQIPLMPPVAPGATLVPQRRRTCPLATLAFPATGVQSFLL
jgi:hypothetical protein